MLYYRTQKRKDPDDPPDIPDAPGENRRFPIAQKKDIKYKKNTSSI